MSQMSFQTSKLSFGLGCQSRLCTTWPGQIVWPLSPASCQLDWAGDSGHDRTACLTLVWRLEWTNQYNYIGENKKSDSCLATFWKLRSFIWRLLCQTIQPGNLALSFAHEHGAPLSVVRRLSEREGGGLVCVGSFVHRKKIILSISINTWNDNVNNKFNCTLNLFPVEYL